MAGAHCPRCRTAAALGTALGKLGHKLGSKCSNSTDISFQAPLPDILSWAQIFWLLVQPSFLINFKTTSLFDPHISSQNFHIIQSLNSFFLAGKLHLIPCFVFLLSKWALHFFLLIRIFHISLMIQSWSPDPAQRNGSKPSYKMRLWIKEHQQITGTPVKFLFLGFCCSEIIFAHEQNVLNDQIIFILDCISYEANRGSKSFCV